MKLFLIIIVFIIFSFSATNAQTYVLNGGSSNIEIDVDSIFYHFEYPIITKKTYKKIFGSDYEFFAAMTISAYVVVGKYNRVKSIELYPFIGLFNDFPPEHPLWKEIKKSIIKASKSWVFKPIKWKNLEKLKRKKDKDSVEIEIIKQWDKVRPFYGIQRHLIIFEFRCAYLSDHSNPNFLYLINVSIPND